VIHTAVQVEESTVQDPYRYFHLLLVYCPALRRIPSEWYLQLWFCNQSLNPCIWSLRWLQSRVRLEPLRWRIFFAWYVSTPKSKISVCFRIDLRSLVIRSKGEDVGVVPVARGRLKRAVEDVESSDLLPDGTASLRLGGCLPNFWRLVPLSLFSPTINKLGWKRWISGIREGLVFHKTSRKSPNWVGRPEGQSCASPYISCHQLPHFTAVWVPKTQIVIVGMLAPGIIKRHYLWLLQKYSTFQSRSMLATWGVAIFLKVSLGQTISMSAPKIFMMGWFCGQGIRYWV